MLHALYCTLASLGCNSHSRPSLPTPLVTPHFAGPSVSSLLPSLSGSARTYSISVSFRYASLFPPLASPACRNSLQSALAFAPSSASSSNTIDTSLAINIQRRLHLAQPLQFSNPPRMVSVCLRIPRIQATTRPRGCCVTDRKTDNRSSIEIAQCTRFISTPHAIQLRWFGVAHCTLAPRRPAAAPTPEALYSPRPCDPSIPFSTSSTQVDPTRPAPPRPARTTVGAVSDTTQTHQTFVQTKR